MAELLWGSIRTLRDSIRADKNHLENAPLGPIQKKRLATQIAKQKARLTILLKENKLLQEKFKRSSS